MGRDKDADRTPTPPPRSIPPSSVASHAGPLVQNIPCAGKRSPGMLNLQCCQDATEGQGSEGWVKVNRWYPDVLAQQGHTPPFHANTVDTLVAHFGPISTHPTALHRWTAFQGAIWLNMGLLALVCVGPRLGLFGFGLGEVGKAPSEVCSGAHRCCQFSVFDTMVPNMGCKML